MDTQDSKGRTIIGRYTGPAYPFGPDVEGTFGPKQDINVVVSSIYNIISTQKGSVPYAPLLGSVIPSMLFEPLDSVTMGLLRHFAEKDLGEQEPRIAVSGARVERTGDYQVTISIVFSIIGDPFNRTYNAPFTFTRNF